MQPAEAYFSAQNAQLQGAQGIPSPKIDSINELHLFCYEGVKMPEE